MQRAAIYCTWRCLTARWDESLVCLVLIPKIFGAFPSWSSSSSHSCMRVISRFSEQSLFTRIYISGGKKSARVYYRQNNSVVHKMCEATRPRPSRVWSAQNIIFSPLSNCEHLSRWSSLSKILRSLFLKTCAIHFNLIKIIALRILLRRIWGYLANKPHTALRFQVTYFFSFCSLSARASHFALFHPRKLSEQFLDFYSSFPYLVNLWMNLDGSFPY